MHMKLVDFIAQVKLVSGCYARQIYRYYSWELVQIFATRSVLSRHCRLSTKNIE